MKKTLLALFFFCFISANIFAQNLELYQHPQNGEDIYFTDANPNTIRNIVFTNNVIVFGTNNIHGYDDFLYIFQNHFVERIISEDWFRREDLGDDLYPICRAFLDRGSALNHVPSRLHTIMVIPNGNYGLLVWWWGETRMRMYFFEFKEN